MDHANTKPRLVFFQYKYDERLPAFLLTHKREHVKCLSEFFEVIVVSEDCDYRQICDEYAPELALFESGVNHESCQRLEIKNAHHSAEIPKLGLHHGDGFCNARAGFLSDMEHWGIDTYFSISTTAAEHTPEIADKLYSWPVFIDAEIYRDYCGWKSIPVLFTGNTRQFYPWRTKILKLVSEHYPSLICPHPGYQPRSKPARLMVGEDYARTINASFFVPACGTIAREVVRKHFEIPGSKACLIAEKTPALEAAGFVDMKNCVFADEDDVLDKLSYLFQHPEELQAITCAGYQLVHSRHTLKHRDQILQWFNLSKGLKPHEKIIQPGPFEPLAIVPISSAFRTSHITANGLHLALLRQGDEKLWGGKYDEAERLYLRSLSYMRWMPELKLRLALCNLYKGDAKAALSWIDEPIHFILCTYKAIDPDPVEWAYFILSLLCLGKLNDAAMQAGKFPWLRHPELDRARWLVNVLKNKGFTGPRVNDDTPGRRRSIHQLPARNLKEWIEQLCIMLKSCRQFDMAKVLTKFRYSESETVHAGEAREDEGANGKMSIARAEDRDQQKPSTKTVSFFRKRIFYRTLRLRLKGIIARVMHGLETKCGYFLPYGLSESRNDELFKSIQSLACIEEIKTALIIGAAPGKYSTEALLAGLLENENHPSIFCIRAPRGRLLNGREFKYDTTQVRWYEPTLSSRTNLSQAIEKTVERIGEDNHISSFDLLFIDGTGFKQGLTLDETLSKTLHSTKFIILDDLNDRNNFMDLDALFRDPNYFLSAQNPGLRNGYAIFKRYSTSLSEPGCLLKKQ